MKKVERTGMYSDIHNTVSTMDEVLAQIKSELEKDPDLANKREFIFSFQCFTLSAPVPVAN